MACSENNTTKSSPSNLVSITPRPRTQLAKSRGREYWRHLEEYAETEEFEQFIQREFPSQASEFNDPHGRRRFLKLMGASLALAGVGGCAWQPREQIVPYIQQPEEIVPGRPLFFTTAMSLGGVASGLLVRSNEGRPTKIEGNPDHPNNLGATDLFSQASILTLYDPDRSKITIYRGDIRPWSELLGVIRNLMEGKSSTQGAGVRILTETVSSPTLARQINTLITQYPQVKWHQYEPAGREGASSGAQLAFGEPVNTIYRFEEAERILSIDSDFLSCGPGSLRYARGFARKRKPETNNNEMNRLYAVESTPTNTGAVADHRIPLRPSEIETFTRVVAAALGIGSGPAPGAQLHGVPAEWIPALVKDLQAHQGRSIVIPGDEQPPVVHALCHLMNQMLGNVGTTVVFTDPIQANSADGNESLRELVSDIDAGAVDTLVILGGNPVYTAPADLNFRGQLEKVNLRIHLGLYNDETAEVCHWHVPETHYLEQWSDARTFDGTCTIVQPLIEPLYDGIKSAHEILALFTNEQTRTPYDAVRAFWQTQNQSGDFEAFWRKALHDGVIPNTALPPKNVTARTDFLNAPSTPPDNGAQGERLEIVFRPDPSIYDGRFSNNGWLQELPKPFSKLTWDNAAYFSPNTAERLGIGYDVGWKGSGVNTDVVELRYRGRTVKAPVWIVPGQPDDTVTVHFGYGRRRAGRVGNEAGFNAYALRTSDRPWHGTGLEVVNSGERQPLAATQIHFNMEGRDHVRSSTLVDFLKEQTDTHEGKAAGGGHHTEVPDDLSLYPKWNYNEDNKYSWGMAVDLNSCVGCNACVVACQSENNIPVVGKEQVQRGREMHWLRIDSYYQGGEANNPDNTYFMPVPCMHCENAPCEPVCPVEATVHDAEGLNVQVYNRCIGTRYCSNNCPYKVRRFNFLLYQDWETPQYKMMRNKEVSVRSRGVMEKCTYCTQRIQWAKIEASKERRHIRDGEMVTACQAVCPAEAIVFGDLNDSQSAVRKVKDSRRNYSLLGELGVRPRTTYLAALRNPNPEIRPAETHGTEQQHHE